MADEARDDKMEFDAVFLPSFSKDAPVTYKVTGLAVSAPAIVTTLETTAADLEVEAKRHQEAANATQNPQLKIRALLNVEGDLKSLAGIYQNLYLKNPYSHFETLSLTASAQVHRIRAYMCELGVEQCFTNQTSKDHLRDDRDQVDPVSKVSLYTQRVFSLRNEAAVLYKLVKICADSQARVDALDAALVANNAAFDSIRKIKIIVIAYDSYSELYKKNDVIKQLVLVYNTIAESYQKMADVCREVVLKIFDAQNIVFVHQAAATSYKRIARIIADTLPLLDADRELKAEDYHYKLYIALCNQAIALHSAADELKAAASNIDPKTARFVDALNAAATAYQNAAVAHRAAADGATNSKDSCEAYRAESAAHKGRAITYEAMLAHFRDQYTVGNGLPDRCVKVDCAAAAAAFSEDEGRGFETAPQDIVLAAEEARRAEIDAARRADEKDARPPEAAKGEGHTEASSVALKPKAGAVVGRDGAAAALE